MEQLNTWVTFGIFLFLLVLTLGLSIGIFASRTLRTPLEHSFLGYLSLVIVWNFSALIAQIPLGNEVQLIITRIASPAWIFLGVTSYAFFSNLAGRVSVVRIRIVALVAIIASAISISTPWVENGIQQFYLGYYFTPGILRLPVALIVVITPFIMGLYLVYKRIKEASAEEQKALLFILKSSPFLAAIPLIFSAITPLWGFEMLSTLGTTIFSLIIFIYYRVIISREEISPSMSKAAGTLFYEMHEGILLTDLRGRIEELNPAAEKLLNVIRQDVIGKNISSVIDGFSHDIWYKDYPFNLPHRESFNLTVVLQKNKGIPIGKLAVLKSTTELTKSTGFNAEADPRSAALQIAHERIRVREQQLQTLVDSLPFQVFVKDIEGRFILQNKLDRDTRGNLLGREFHEIESNPESLAQSLLSDGKALTGEIIESEYETEVDGQIRKIRSIKRPLFSENGNITGILGILMDVTELRKLELERMEFKERLLKSHKMEAIGTLAGGIAHDFNNILGSLTGYAELAVETLPEDLPAQKYLKEVLIASERGRQLVQQILTFSRKDDKEKKPVAVVFTLRETIALLEGNLPSNIRIKTDLPTSEKFVLGDPVDLHRIVMNLCQNSLHAMKAKGGNIYIDCKEVFNKSILSIWNVQIPPGKWVEISIRDEGQGIPEDRINRIFDPFFTTKKTSEGTGLGLSVVLGIVHAWGGKIALHSTPEIGTEFKIILPALAHNHRKQDVSSDQTTPILITTENETIRSLIANACKEFNIQWHTTSRIDELPRLWRVAPWKIAIIDQKDQELPVELLVQQWRSQGLQCHFLIFLNEDLHQNHQEIDFLDRVAAFDIHTPPDQIKEIVRRLLW